MKDLFDEVMESELEDKCTIGSIIDEVVNLTWFNDPEDEIQTDINELLKSTIQAVVLKTIMVLDKKGLIDLNMP